MQNDEIYPLIVATMAHLSEGVVIANDEGDVIYTNASALSLLELGDAPRKLREIRGINIGKSALKAALQQGEADAAGRPSGRFVSFREVIRTEQGERCVEFKTGTVRCALNSIPLRVLILSDRTHERRYEAFFNHRDENAFITHDIETLNLIERVEQVAPINVPVLLEGESGTGKTRIARMIHVKSTRSTMPFVEVNCAAVPDSLLETEFFGHIKGSFTGAHKDRIGRFQAANGGTLFLDEIGEIPLTLQPKLLRALQDQTFEPVGSNRPVKVDIRIIAASNQDLKTMVQDGRFRADLYYRLAVIPLRVPALRERPADIRLLIDHFIEQVCLRLQIDRPTVTPNALQLMMDYPWPGNVRELINAIEHGVICAVNGQIVPDSLPVDIRKRANSSIRTSPTEQIDRESLLATLQATQWNRSRAAENLGIDRSTLWRWMQRMHIQPPND
ncbi:sigma-54 interaction domain-containing protein [Acidihalobacter ferrooxydans]|nr:sigma-54 dependent transcriptional regulator [Acidihalobacter ferrooxydans]